MQRKNGQSPVKTLLIRGFDSSYFTHRQIFSMLVPLILDAFFVNIIELLATAMISSSSQESVSAVSLVSPIYMMSYAFFLAVASGGAVIVAQCLGSGDIAKMRRYGGQVIFAMFLLSLIGCGILVTFARPIVGALFGTADPGVADRAARYLFWVAISQVFLAVFHGPYAVFRGMGKTRLCLVLTMVINLIHLFASYVFINILRWDIFGTAMSLMTARIIGAAVSVALLFFSKQAPGITLRDIFHINFHEQKTVMRVSLPFAVEQLFINGGSLVNSMFIVRLGTESVAANAVAASSIAIFYCMGNAVSSLSITVVGQCVGAGDKKQAVRYGKSMTLLGEGAVIASLALFLPVLNFILRLYSAPETEFVLIRQIQLYAFIAMPFFWALASVLPNVLRAAGDLNFTSYSSLITLWTVRIGLAYLLAIPAGLGIHGVWICIVIEWALKAALYGWRFASGKWLSKSLLKENE